ncbi:MAG: MBL fold metallo-hydrolase [Dehalococcoidia bacterium]|nr:MBL fold metallo-hydrolase [Dehalococcoidia bacterium]NUQ54643.1 MBL fold metallo-hydrolase [Dehalococcoidia bacterium]
MSELSLSFVGTGNAFAPGGLCWNGFLVNGRYLFEAPPQALMSLRQEGVDPNDLDAVVVSHHHADHFLGLPFLLLYWKYQGRTRPVRIVGPPETREVMEQVTERTYPSLFEVSYEIEWLVAEPGKDLHLSGLQLHPVEVKHDDKLIMSLGFACTLNGKRFGYTGDTAICDGVLDLARHSQVLVSECASRASSVPIHMNLVDDMPVVRAALNPDSTLLLTHIDSDVDSNGLPNTLVARDHQTYRF